MTGLQPIAENVLLLSGDTHPKICSNVYVLEGPDSLALIDSGVDVPRLQAALKPLGKPIETVFFTHGHFDHVQAAIKAQINGQMAAADLDVIHELNAAWVNIQKPDFFTPFGNGRIRFTPFDLDIIPTPGHTPGSVSFFDKKHGILFSGDCKFADGGVGRADFWGSNAHELEKSLAKIDRLDYRLLAPGHGPIEKRANRR
ncbi:MBL fold metallo-hydrolase [Candidatus Micrarchaeota archaeon]|nr:MBL fold metallo-hydrolase [Candidatus Micrarchaeota archaeon]